MWRAVENADTAGTTLSCPMQRPVSHHGALCFLVCTPEKRSQLQIGYPVGGPWIRGRLTSALPGAGRGAPGGKRKIRETVKGRIAASGTPRVKPTSPLIFLVRIVYMIRTHLRFLAEKLRIASCVRGSVGPKIYLA